MSNNYQLILLAIQTKKQVTATYEGYYREMCPHVIGTKKDKQQALFYQFGGESSSGSITLDNSNWKCMQIDKLTNVKLQATNDK